MRGNDKLPVPKLRTIIDRDLFHRAPGRIPSGDVHRIRLSRMQFESADPSVVRSIKQRDLLNAWLRAAQAASPCPLLGDFDPDASPTNWPT